MTGIAEYDPSDFEQGRQTKQDETLLVKFYLKTIQDKAASEEAGRPIYKEREYIDIRIPGTRGAGAARPASLRDKKRFERHYQAFKQRIELPLEGTPLSEWPMVSRSLSEELAFVGVKTVEQMANMADGNASQMMGGQNLKAKAIEWLARASAEVSAGHLETELKQRDAQIAELSAKLETLLAIQDKPKRKRRTKEEIERDNQQLDIGQRIAESGGG